MSFRSKNFHSIKTNNGSVGLAKNKCFFIAVYHGLEALQKQNVYLPPILPLHKFVEKYAKNFKLNEMMDNYQYSDEVRKSIMDANNKYTKDIMMAQIHGKGQCVINELTQEFNLKINVFYGHKFDNKWYEKIHQPDLILGEGKNVINILNTPGHFEYIISFDDAFQKPRTNLSNTKQFNHKLVKSNNNEFIPSEVLEASIISFHKEELRKQIENEERKIENEQKRKIEEEKQRREEIYRRIKMVEENEKRKQYETDEKLAKKLQAQLRQENMDEKLAKTLQVQFRQENMDEECARKIEEEELRKFSSNYRNTRF